VVVVPTAYTHPAGTVYVSDYDIFLLQAGYAVAEGTQLTLTSTIPIEGLVLADMSLKVALVREGPVRVAAIGSATGIWGLDVGDAIFGRAGGVAQFCLDEACDSSANLGGTLLLGGPDTLLGAGLGFIWHAVSWLSVLGEVETLLPMTPQAGNVNGIAFSPGVRLPFRTWSLDFAITRPLGVAGAPTIPLLAFTLRVLP
jgi:hypothetical protein